MDAYLQPRAQEASNQFGFDDAFSASHETCTENRPVIRRMRRTARDFRLAFELVFSSRDNVDAEIDTLRRVHLGMHRIVRYVPRSDIPASVRLIHNPPFIDGDDREQRKIHL